MKRKKAAPPLGGSPPVASQQGDAAEDAEASSSQRRFGGLGLAASQPSTARNQPLKPLSPPALPAGSSKLWPDKHAPASAADLAVHKKKVEEVRAWLELQRSRGGAGAGGHVILLTGPPGAGKSATVHALAGALGFEVCEWTTPTPTLWSERPQVWEAGAVPYTSKLDDFSSFVHKASLFPQLPLTSTRAVPPSAGEGSKGGTAGPAGLGRPQPKILLIDDLPHVHDGQRQGALAAMLGDLAAGARFPTVIISTDSTEASGRGRGAPARVGGAGRGLGSKRSLDVVREALEAAGAAHIAFNPVTAAATAKVLARVAEHEGLALESQAVDAIAEGAGGDLRHALASLQLHGTGAVAPAGGLSRARAKKPKGSTKGKGKLVGDVGGARVEKPAVDGAKDLSLGLFHALGKLLYNKRLAEGEAATAGGKGAGGSRREECGAGGARGGWSQWLAAGSAEWVCTVCTLVNPAGPRSACAACGAVPPAAAASGASRAAKVELLPDLVRRPSLVDAEGVVAASHMEAGSIIAFLHENLPEFVDHEAIGDLSCALEYLSDASVLLSRFKGRVVGAAAVDEQEGGVEVVPNAAAASVGARGVMFANAHPAPRRWQPLRGPRSFAAEKARQYNRESLTSAAETGQVRGVLPPGLPIPALATEVLPSLRVVARARGGVAEAGLPPRWAGLGEDGQMRTWDTGAVAPPAGHWGGDVVGGTWEVDDDVEDVIEYI